MLKVSSPQPPTDMPPMDMMDNNMPVGDEMDNENGMMGNEPMPPMDNSEMNMDYGGEANPFDTNFDAGVDADEENDPERYIQQLTGKLSQTLNKYNEQLPRADRNLSKYVAGMILKQATKGLSPDDVNDIMDDLKQDDNSMQESVSSRKINLDEIFQDVMQPSDEEDKSEVVRNIGFRKKPFTAPRFN